MNILRIMPFCLVVVTVRSFLVYNEGEQAEILFHYDITDLLISLGIQYRGLFFENGQMVKEGLSESQFKRYQVEERVKGDILEVSVTISQVSREDGGTYICEAYIDGLRQEGLMKKISLLVEYPPGKPSCKQVSSTNSNMITHVWNMIECVALIGSIPGTIVCFQNDEILPPKTDLIQNATTMIQMVWARKGIQVLCCTSGYENINDAKMLCTNIENGQGRIPLFKEITTPKTPKTSSDSLEKDASSGNTEFDKYKYEMHTLSDIPEAVVVYLVLIGTIFHISLSILLYRKTRRRLIIKDKSRIKDMLTNESREGYGDDSRKEAAFFLRSSARSSSSGIESTSSS